MARTGRPPVPIEKKRARGNPGKRPLPDPATTPALPAVEVLPDPTRPLGPPGRELWDRAWTAGAAWIARTDLELLLMTCEQLDERVALRAHALQSPGDLDRRRALRDLDKQIVGNLSLLGFTPTDRTRLGLAEVKRASKLEELRSRRSAG
ncbi:MAG: phage terminase small subunit P27 family [Actinobacteria bacterium]|nr:phage terminase small subunit P27 family [Actinomycetota bacterium]